MSRSPLFLISLFVIVPSLPAFAQYGLYDVPPPNPYVVMPPGWGGGSPLYSPPTPTYNPIRELFIESIVNPRSNSCTVVEGYYVSNRSRCTQIGTTRNGQPIWSCC